MTEDTLAASPGAGPAVATPAGAPPAKETFAVPEEIGDDLLDELFARTKPAGTTPAAPDATAAASPAEEAPPADSEDDDEPQVDPRVQAQQMVQEMIPRIAAEIAARMQGGQGQTAAERDVKDQIVEEFVARGGEGTDRAAMSQLAEFVVKLADAKAAERVSSLQQRVDQMSALQQQQASEQVMGKYAQHINALCEKAGITSAFDREAVAKIVADRGMRRYGPQFSFDKVDRVFREVNSERVRERHGVTVAQTTAKQTAQAAEPPVKAASGAATGAESVRHFLTHPRERGWGLRGRNFQKLVGQAIDAMEARVDKTLG